MKIKVTDKSYSEVLKLPKTVHKNPIRQRAVWRLIMRLASAGELKQTHFQCEKIGMEKRKGTEPCLYLMNHSSFTDLQIAATLLAKEQYHIVCTNDGLIGKAGLMRRIGCIPTRKFIMDLDLIKDMRYAVNQLGSSLLMYPEASYSFDGSETPLPESLGKCLKLLKIPVIMIKTEGAFLRDPLYNGLQKRQVNVKATMEYLISPEMAKEQSVEELNAILRKTFHYDHFRQQKAANVLVREKFRADGLHRVLYQCPACRQEGKMLGKGIEISCQICGKAYTLQEDGTLRAGEKSLALPEEVLANGFPKKSSLQAGTVQEDGTEFTYVTDWYRWERENVRKEIQQNRYRMDLDVKILVLADEKSMYHIGDGHLTHTTEGFFLQNEDGTLSYHQGTHESYSLYADYFWYEIGDMICIGNTKYQYYCFPKETEKWIVAKARLAAEEMCKM